MSAAPDPTTELLHRLKRGDRRALDTLFQRVTPRLLRWTSRRLPRQARDIADTADIVQDTLMRSVGALRQLEPRGKGSVDAYLRQASLNRIRDELRRAARRPLREDLHDVPGNDSPLLDAISREDADRYERCLTRLRDADRRAIVGRLTDGLTYEQLADSLGKPSAGAARVAVTRALMRLAAEMQRDAAAV